MGGGKGSANLGKHIFVDERLSRANPGGRNLVGG